MPTDYLLFIHGVNTHYKGTTPNYADELFDQIKSSASSPSRPLEKITIYWGDVTDPQEAQLRAAYQASPLWERFWFREFRETTLLQFTGDTALYLSRNVGSQVVDIIKDQTLQGLSNCTPDDRLHLVTHSLGTVILFDILFSSRWAESDVPGYDSATAIRNIIFGVPPNPTQGIKIGSITTMGSPMAIFSLMDAKNTQGKTSTHDIAPRLEELLSSLHREIGRRLPWRNFAHPGDPIAYPLATLLPSLVDGESRYLDVQDVVTHPADLSDFVTEPFSQTLLALLHGGTTHGSYWHSVEVAQGIVQSIRQAR